MGQSHHQLLISCTRSVGDIVYGKVCLFDTSFLFWAGISLSWGPALNLGLSFGPHTELSHLIHQRLLRAASTWYSSQRWTSSWLRWVNTAGQKERWAEQDEQCIGKIWCAVFISVSDCEQERGRRWSSPVLALRKMQSGWLTVTEEPD